MTLFLSGLLAFSTLARAASDSRDDKSCGKLLNLAPLTEPSPLNALVAEMEKKDSQLYALKRDNKGMSAKGNKLRKRLLTLHSEIRRLDPDFKFDPALEHLREATGASMVGISPSDAGWLPWNPFNLMAVSAQKRELEKAEKNETQKAKLREEVEVVLNQSGDLAAHLMDFLQFLWLRREVPGHSVAVLSGADQGAEKTSELVVAVRTLTKAGFAVVYDADAPTAPLIAEAAGARGIGISSGAPVAKAPPEHTVLTIRNPYLRLKAFTFAERSVATQDSLIGLALRVEGRLHYSMGWPEQLSDEFSNWAATARPQLSLRTGSLINQFSTAQQMADHVKLNFRGSSPRGFAFDAQSAMADMHPEDLRSVLESSRLLFEAEAQMRAMEAPAGVAFFGSGMGHFTYEKLVYLAARALGERGITVVTGGAGGFMELANRGAYDGGAHSIGIPIVSGHRPKNEDRVAHEFHTLTVPASNYETRIPLLLYQRKAAIMAPGGPGTMKELATALAAGKRIILLGAYYEPLLKWFHATAMPEEVKSRISLCLSVEELKSHLDRLAFELGDEVGNLQAQVPPPPRHELPGRFGGVGPAEKPSQPVLEFEPPPESFVSPPVSPASRSRDSRTQHHFQPVFPDEANAASFEILGTPVTQELWFRVVNHLRRRWVKYYNLPSLPFQPSPSSAQAADGIDSSLVATWIEGLNDLSAAGDKFLEILFEAHRDGDRFRIPTPQELQHAAGKFSDLDIGFRLVRKGKPAR